MSWRNITHAKYFLFLSFLLHLIFYAGVAALVHKDEASALKPQTQKAIEFMIKDMHRQLFEKESVVRHIVKDYYNGLLSKEELRTSFAVNNILNVEVVEEAGTHALLEDAPVSELPQDLQNSIGLFYPHSAKTVKILDDFRYSVILDLKNTDNFLRPHIITFVLDAQTLKPLQKLHMMDFTIVSWNQNLNHNWIYSTFLKSLLPSVKQVISWHIPHRLESQNGIKKGDALFPFDSAILGNEHFLFVPFVLSTSETSKVLAIYSLSVKNLISKSQQKNLYLLLPFVLLSFLITIGMYYLSRP